MKRLGLFVLLVSACAPGVDPDASFTLHGKLVDALGAPATGIRAYVYRVGSLVQAENNFLQSPDVFSGLESLWGTTVSTPTDVSDATGAFSLTMKGSEVNAADGTRGYLAVVHYAAGQDTASLATASDWSYFTDVDPDWDVGELKLWDGGSGSQSGATVNFTWATNPAPAGFQTSTQPYFLFVYPYSPNEPLRWAEVVSTGQTASMPRAAFPENPPPTQAPGFFLTGFSKEQSGSRQYQHRTDFKAIQAWSAITRSNLSVSLFEGSLNSAVVGNAATDGNYDPDVSAHLFGANVEDFFIDLGATNTPFQEVLLFSLALHNYGNADIRLFTSNIDNPAVAGDWTQLGAAVLGEWEFENWVYLGNTTGGTARWIRVNVDRKNASGVRPYFASLTEVKVLQQ